MEKIRTMAEKRDQPGDAPNVITLDVAARLLEIGPERIRQLMRDGYIPREKPGRVSLVGAVQGYIRFLKELASKQTKTAADSDVRRERAREIKLRNDIRTRELIPFEEAAAEYDALVAAVREAMDSIPARVTRDIQLRRKIEAEVHAAKETILKALGRATEAARTGKPSDGSAAD